MSSGIVFQGRNYYCSNGTAEYLLGLCVTHFTDIKGHERFPHLLEYFIYERDTFFGGLLIFIDPDFLYGDEPSLQPAADYAFLAQLFERVFDFMQHDESSTMTPLGKELIVGHLQPVIEELETYSRRIWGV